jgi:hypothetical protein
VNQIQQQTASTSASNNLNQEIAQSNLTADERAAVQAAMQDVFAQSSSAQALPATTTDVPTGTSRLGSAFASNDPVFKTALAKNPSLTKAFNEYTNTYGFAGGYDYQQLLSESLAQNPNDPNLRAEYEKVTGQQYQAPVSEAERIRQENAAKELTPLEPQQIEDRTVVPVEAPSPDLQDVFVNAPEFTKPVVSRPSPEITPTPAPEVVIPAAEPVAPPATSAEPTPAPTPQPAPAPEPLPVSETTTAPPPIQTAPELPPVTVTATPEVSPDDRAILDLITPREEVRNLPEVTVTPGPEEPERDFDFPDLPEETAVDTPPTDELPEFP